MSVITNKQDSAYMSTKQLQIIEDLDKLYWQKVDETKNQIIDDREELEAILHNQGLWGDLQDWLKGDDDAGYKLRSRVNAEAQTIAERHCEVTEDEL